MVAVWRVSEPFARTVIVQDERHSIVNRGRKLVRRDSDHRERAYHTIWICIPESGDDH